MLRFRTFGAIDLRREDGERLDELLGQPKRLALLAYLAAEQPAGPVRREQLLTLLWPDSAPSDARHALSSTLSRLRNSLSEDVLRGSGEETLWLDREQLRADVARFQEALKAGQHREALSLYQGPFLEGFRLAGARAFEEWAEDRRAAFRNRAYEAGLEAGQAACERGDLEAAEECFRRAHEIDPLKQEVAGRLIRVLADQGERGEALQFYDAFSSRLREELQLSPSSELKELAERIQSDDGEPAPSSGEPTDTSSDRSSASVNVTRTEASGSSPLPSGLRPRYLAVSLLLVLAFMAGGVWAWNAFSPGGTGEPSAAADSASASPTVAVLPFQDLGRDEARSPFLRGFRATLLTQLSQVPEVRVVSETSADRFYNTDLAVPAIADSLRARWVLEGAVQQAGDTVQVHAQLIDSETDTHVWAQTFRRDRTAQHLFGLQRELTRQIIEAVELELGKRADRELTESPTESADAFELYLEARGLSYMEGRSEAETNRAIRLYRRALAIDSTFAEAWAGLADAYADRMWGWDYPRSWADSGIAAARKAIRFDPELPDGYAQLGDHLGTLGRTKAQIDAYREALRLRPAHIPTLNNLTFVLSETGRLAENIRWIERAYQAAPGSADLLPFMPSANVGIGRYEVAEAWLQYARSKGYDLLEDRFRIELFVRNDVSRARSTLERLGKTSDDHLQRRAALAVYEKDWKEALRLYRTFARKYHMAAGGPGRLSAGTGWAVALGRLGRYEEARAVARKTLEALRQASYGLAPSPTKRVHTAVASLVLGDTTRALSKLSEAVDLGFRDLPVMRTVPVWDPLRDRPRFQALVSRIDSLVDVERRKVEKEGWGKPPEHFLN